MPYKIITDSACDLPKDLIKKHNIDVVPIYLYCEEEEYLDKIDIAPLEVHQRLKNGDLFRTAQIPPQIFKQKFEEYAKKNEPCIYLSFSSGLSSTYQSSVIAKDEIKEEYPDFDIEVYDTKSTCGMLGLMVLKAAEIIEAGKSKEELYRMLDHYKNHGEHIFTVDDIEYLYKGGRVSRTSAFIGGLLHIKPILDFEDGKIRALDKVRGTKKLANKIMDYIDQRQDDIKNQIVSIGHSDNYEFMETIKNRLIEEYGCKQIITEYVGSVVSAHSGPGTLAIFFLNKRFED